MPHNWRVWCVGVCLPMCGLLRILVDVLCWCVRPSNVRSRSGQPCSPLLGHPLRGLLPSVVGGYCAGRPICASFAPLARCSGSRPLSRSLRRRSRRLRGDTRRNASSPGYRLLALRRVSPRIRRTASAHVAQFGTRSLVPCLTFHKARFSSQHLRSPTFVGSLSSWGPRGTVVKAMFARCCLMVAISGE